MSLLLSILMLSCQPEHQDELIKVDISENLIKEADKRCLPYGYSLSVRLETKQIVAVCKGGNKKVYYDIFGKTNT